MKKQKKKSFKKLDYAEKAMKVRVLHTGCCTNAEIAERLKARIEEIDEIIERLNLKPNLPRTAVDDGYKVVRRWS